ncbi:transposase [candidate division TA06 bacterium]|uniref:Transposase n=1 Tax=candidate division TA06 bacterium TaxID=2250710 RepID=A0A933IAM3_UNCT6|nr:transposase [candidate division TA06 bacterium]
MNYAVSPWAIAIFCAFVVAALAISYHFARSAKSASGFYVAGGNIHWSVNGIAGAGFPAPGLHAEGVTARRRVIAKLQDTAITKGQPSGLLIIDDTILEKTGKKFSGLRKLYDHAKKKYVKGPSLVQLLYADDQKRYPLFETTPGTRGRKPGPKRNRETSIGKHKIALRLIKPRRRRGGIRLKAALFDAWYAAASFLKALQWLKLQFVCRFNGGWGLLINGRRIKANELTKQKRRYRYYRQLKAQAFCLTAELPNYGPVFVVVVKERRRKPVVIITSIMDSDIVTIIELYRQRWTIETYFKKAKQRFGLDKFQSASGGLGCGNPSPLGIGVVILHPGNVTEAVGTVASGSVLQILGEISFSHHGHRHVRERNVSNYHETLPSYFPENHIVFQ